MKPVYERWIYIIVALSVTVCIYLFNISLIPDFDIGFNAAWISFECLAMTVLFSAVAIFLVRKFTQKDNFNRTAVYFIIALYWLMEWGFCYWKCVLEATRTWNQMMYGPV